MVVRRSCGIKASLDIYTHLPVQIHSKLSSISLRGTINRFIKEYFILHVIVFFVRERERERENRETDKQAELKHKTTSAKTDAHISMMKRYLQTSS